MNNKYNDNITNLGESPFLFLNSHKNDYFGQMKKMLETNQDKHGLLDKAFFSEENLEIIKKQIVLAVYRDTNFDFLIAKPKTEQLLLVMKFTFYEYAQHLPFGIKEQIRKLNAKVVELILPDLVSSLYGYVGYINKINEDISPLDRPLNVSNRGEKTLPSVTTTFF